MKLLSSIEHAGRVHAAVLSQGALGKRWSKLIRELRARAPDLPVVLLLDKRADRTWRRAILAGAFDAVLANVPESEVLEVLSRALAYAGNQAGNDPSPSHDVTGSIGRTPVSAQVPEVASSAEANSAAWNVSAGLTLREQPGVTDSGKQEPRESQDDKC